MFEQQLLKLDFGENKKTDLKSSDMIRAALKWVCEFNEPPNGMSFNVPTRLQKFNASVAAFWSTPKRNPNEGGVYRLFHPTKTMIIECRNTLEGCWPDVTASQDLMGTLHRLRSELQSVEEYIKKQEPYLKTDGSLFDEYAEWNFEKSKNQHYHKLRRKINQAQHAIYHGTYFEQLHRAHLADYMYLAVPAGMIKKSEIADGWGLLWIHEDYTVEEVVEPANENCPLEYRLHLIQNIASSATRSVLFSQGILQKEEEVTLLPKPIRRRARL